MNIAVLSLTRDRLDYTKHCFTSLLENAGCDFDWWITDQGSTDGTVDWLLRETDANVISYKENIGICPALNLMLEDALVSADYDVIVKIDNDCELVQPDTLKIVCELVEETGWILSPWIRGLRQPPAVARADYRVTEMNVVGGIFMAAPASIFKGGYRHPIINTFDGDDFHLSRWYQAMGGHVGYVNGLEAWHYETTDGQWARFPEYFARRQRERELA